MLRRANGTPAANVVTNILLLSVALLTNTGQGFSEPGNWYINSNALTLRVELSLVGPSNSLAVIEWKPDLTEPVFQTNSSGARFGVVGQKWVPISLPFPLTGTTQTFVSGAFGETGFYRVRPL